LAIGDFALGLPVTAQNRVYQNIIWNCQYDGLQFWSTTPGTMSNNQIINNVFYNNSHYGLLIENASDNLIANNIIAWNQLGSISGNAVWDNQISNNLFFHSGEVVGNAAVEGDPLFIDPGKADFHLTAGSPAIDRGINVGLPANGVPDLGAYEFGEDTSGGCSCMVPQEVASFDGWGWVAGSLMVIGFGMSYRYILLRRRRGKKQTSLCKY
jgi:parallel beta-helix repeat protein